MTSRIAVLLVEDSPAFAGVLTQGLIRSSEAIYTVDLADSLKQARQLLQDKRFDVILLDLSLPDVRGMETVVAVNAASPKTPIVVLTANDNESLGRKAVRQGAQDFLIKGQTDERLVSRAIAYAIERRRIIEESDQLIEQLQNALSQVKKLSGLLPICSHCKKIRDDQGYWNQIEQYIDERSEAQFSHGLCPDCMRELYPDLPDNG